MSHIVAAAVFLLIEITVSLSNSHFYLKFIGYIILLRYCKGLDLLDAYRNHKQYIKAMMIFEIIRTAVVLVFYNNIDSGLIYLASILSLCGALYVLKILTDSMLELESKHSLELDAGSLQTGWILIVISSALSYIMQSSQIYALFLVLDLIFKLNYWIKLYLFRKKLFQTLPSDIADEYK